MNIFEKVIYWIQEKRKLRRCDTLEQFDAYAPVLGSPENIAWWVAQIIFFEDEQPIDWYPLAHALESRMGNCTETAGLNVRGVRLLPGHKAEILCIFGRHKRTGEKKGHAICCFEDGRERGYIEGKNVARFPKSFPWEEIMTRVRKDWEPKLTSWRWADYKGNTIFPTI